MTVEPERFEDKAQEIEKTAERYVAHRWVNWVPFAMMAIGMGWMLLAAWLVRFGLELAGLSWESPRGYSLYQWIFVPLMFVGILTLICLFAAWYEPWRRRKLAVTTKAMARPPSFKQVLVTSLYIGIFVGLSHRIEAAPLRFQPLLLGLCCAVLPIVFLAAGWIPRPRKSLWSWLWEESPVAAVALIVGASYAVAVAAGLPQPWVRSLAKCGTFLRVMIPFGIIWLLSIIAGEIYSRTQFRRLQRLVAEPPAEGGE